MKVLRALSSFDAQSHEVLNTGWIYDNVVRARGLVIWLYVWCSAFRVPGSNTNTLTTQLVCTHRRKGDRVQGREMDRISRGDGKRRRRRVLIL
jgi:hypothetical protein